MTLIVTAMIGNYSIMAADRKQTIDPNFWMFQNFVPDITKIILHDGVAFTGSGNASILDIIKQYYKNLIDKDINKVLLDHTKYFNETSDFKGLNFVTSTVITGGIFLNIFHLQDEKSYYIVYIRSDQIYNNDAFKIVILPPSDINPFVFDIKNCCETEFLKLVIYDEYSIINALKNIFKIVNTKSKQVSSDFDVVFLPISNGNDIKYIKN